MSSIRPVPVNNSELLFVANSSKANKLAQSGVNTIDVYSIEGFAINQILLIGNFGNEGAEIIKTSAATAPSGNTITLASNLIKDHQQDSDVYSLVYDQVELSHSATIDGTKTVLETVTINPEEADFVLTDDTQSDGYYFVRYYNSISTDFSDYSDPIPHSGFEPDTVGAVVQAVLDDMSTTISKSLTQGMLIEALNRMLRMVRGRINKWSNYQKFNHKLSTIEFGKNAYDLPDDIYTKDTNRCLKSVKIGTDLPMHYVDKDQYDVAVEEMIQTNVTTAANIGDSSLALDNISDLDEEGNISVFVDNVKYIISYTGKDVANCCITGIPATGDGAITVAIPADSYVWDNETYSKPQIYTVADGQILIPFVVTNEYIGKSVFIDYWTDIGVVDSEGDVLVMPRYDMAFYYLKSYVRSQLENNAKIDLNDPDYVEFQRILADAIRRETTGQRKRRAPRMNGVFYPNSLNNNPVNRNR